MAGRSGKIHALADTGRFRSRDHICCCRGLDETWEGRVLDKDSVDELIELSREYGFNAAGEGGEYETKVIGFP